MTVSRAILVLLLLMGASLSPAVAQETGGMLASKNIGAADSNGNTEIPDSQLPGIPVKGESGVIKPPYTEQAVAEVQKIQAPPTQAKFVAEAKTGSKPDYPAQAAEYQALSEAKLASGQDEKARLEAKIAEMREFGVKAGEGGESDASSAETASELTPSDQGQVADGAKFASASSMDKGLKIDSRIIEIQKVGARAEEGNRQEADQLFQQHPDEITAKTVEAVNPESVAETRSEAALPVQAAELQAAAEADKALPPDADKRVQSQSGAPEQPAAVESVTEVKQELAQPQVEERAAVTKFEAAVSHGSVAETKNEAALLDPDPVAESRAMADNEKVTALKIEKNLQLQREGSAQQVPDGNMDKVNPEPLRLQVEEQVTTSGKSAEINASTAPAQLQTAEAPVAARADEIGSSLAGGGAKNEVAASAPVQVAEPQVVSGAGKIPVSDTGRSAPFQSGDAAQPKPDEKMAEAKAKSAQSGIAGTVPEKAQPGSDVKASEVLAAEAVLPDRNVPQHVNALLDAVQKAVLKSPEVLARWDTFRASVRETDAARAGYFPRVDLTMSKGRETYSTPYITAPSMGRRGATLTLTQMLYDGFATRNEVRRLTNVQLTRYYELLDASETAALDALRSYYDVVRMRKLFELTEDNYVVHRKAFEHIKQKVIAGVGRRVDLEQASGRLALSKSNLTLDNANVHDASARYQRIVGELPPQEMVTSESEATQETLDKQILPNAAAATLAVAVESHPAILAAVENVRSAKFDMYQRWAKFQPTINLQFSQTRNTNYSGLAGDTKDTVAEVVMTWNLFNGGADRARSSQYARRLDAARDQRDKTCRDIRMTLAIAYNDISKLREQLDFMNQHQISIGKAVKAYQKQFEIGQRSLLDVLDSENELYQAKRSYLNAQYDLYIAQARTVAGMGQLAGLLGLARLETPDLPERLGVSADGPETCLPDPPLANTYNFDELNARATEEMEAAKPRHPVDVDKLDEGLDGGSDSTPDANAGTDGINAADEKAAAEADAFMKENNKAKTEKPAEEKDRAAKPKGGEIEDVINLLK